MTKSSKGTGTRRFARTPQTDTPAASSEQETQRASSTSEAAAERIVKPDSKIARVITLLKRPEGATLAEMIDATGWLPHTTRAALTGLKKKGHTLEKTKRDDVTCYRITSEA